MSSPAGEVYAGGVRAYLNGFHTLFRNELEIHIQRGPRFEGESAGGRRKAGQRDGDFVFARQQAGEGVKPALAGNGGDLALRGQVFQGDPRVRPHRLHLICSNREDHAADAPRFGGGRGHLQEAEENQYAGTPAPRAQVRSHSALRFPAHDGQRLHVESRRMERRLGALPRPGASVTEGGEARDLLLRC
jgi:hypothetical protein